MKLLKLVPDNTNIDFVRLRGWAFGLTLLLSVIAVGLTFYHGLNFGVDFEGGYATYDSATGKVDVKTNEKGDARNNAVQAGTTAGDSDIAAAASSANSATSATPTAAATATGSEAAGEEAAAHATTGATGAAAGTADLPTPISRLQPKNKNLLSPI